MSDTTVVQNLSLADWTQGVNPSAIQELLAIAASPDILSFALGLPAAELFPTLDYAQAVASTLTGSLTALQYGPPDQALKRHIVDLMALRNVSCSERQVFLTSGAQQGMSLLARLLLNTRGTVLLEETIYSGILQAIEPLRPEVVTVPNYPGSGIDIEAVASLFAQGYHPAFLYVISDGHNPLGVSLSLEQRQRLATLAEQYGVPILEDDAYGLLCYNTPSLPPIKALCDKWVFYIGSFSKILAPALRVGWLVVPEELVPILSTLKEGSDIHTATFAQRSITTYLDTHSLPAHITLLRQSYSERRDAMLHAIDEHFPVGTRCYGAKSGMFLWVELPDQLDMQALLQKAIYREKVAFVPGAAFNVGNSQRVASSMRLNFSRCDIAQIETGIARLGRLL